jgi:alkylation response protein AidB-like acyl-CoA dehydrogenase
MRTTEVEIIDTWDSLGMRDTDSNDIAANGVFVPESRAFRFEPDSVPSAPFDGPLYRMPALAATYPIIAPVALAVAGGAIRELREIATTKVPLGSISCIEWAAPTGSTRGAGSSATSATRRQSDTTASSLIVAWRRSDRSISGSNRSFRSWLFEARGD